MRQVKTLSFVDARWNRIILEIGFIPSAYHKCKKTAIIIVQQKTTKSKFAMQGKV